MASQEKIDQLQQQQQARHKGDRGIPSRGEVEGYDYRKDPAEVARRENLKKEEEARNREGSGVATRKESNRTDEDRRRSDGRGRQDGSFRQDRPRLDPKPVVGLEARENRQENKTAKLILELGKISIAVKIVCGEVLKYAEHADTESTDVEEEKNRLTMELGSYVDAGDELRKLLVAKERPTVADLEITKSQTTIHIMELLREIENLDSTAIKLPETGTIEWRRLEKAKNELRAFIGDTDSIVPIPETPLRPNVQAPRLPNKIRRLPLDADDAARNFASYEANNVAEDAKEDALRKEVVHLATVKLAQDAEPKKKDVSAMNAEVIRRHKNGEQITEDELIKQGYLPEEASKLLRLLSVIKK